MSESDQRILDEFGKALMEQVRDPTVNGIRQFLSGDVPLRDARALHRSLESLGLRPDQYDIVGRLLMDAVERTMSNFVDFLQGKDFRITFRDQEGREYDVSAMSDWLVGELKSDDGWIAKFSSYKRGAPIQKLR
jgi:hypothetical protein